MSPRQVIVKCLHSRLWGLTYRMAFLPFTGNILKIHLVRSSRLVHFILVTPRGWPWESETRSSAQSQREREVAGDQLKWAQSDAPVTARLVIKGER